MMSFLAEQKNIQIRFNNRLNEEKFFKIDLNRVQQVIVNLISNALKFSNQGS